MLTHRTAVVLLAPMGFSKKNIDMRITPPMGFSKKYINMRITDLQQKAIKFLKTIMLINFFLDKEILTEYGANGPTLVPNLRNTSLISDGCIGCKQLNSFIAIEPL